MRGFYCKNLTPIKKPAEAGSLTVDHFFFEGETGLTLGLGTAGFTLNQIWSVVESDGVWIYGPSGHIINLLGYICTKETHNGDIYYYEEANNDHLVEALGLAETAFGENPIKETAGDYMAALMDAENEGLVDDEDFRDHLVGIRDWLLAE